MYELGSTNIPDCPCLTPQYIEGVHRVSIRGQCMRSGGGGGQGRNPESFWHANLGWRQLRVLSYKYNDDRPIAKLFGAFSGSVVRTHMCQQTLQCQIVLLPATGREICIGFLAADVTSACRDICLSLGTE